MEKKWSEQFVKVIYVLVFCGLVWFVVRQGTEPWRIMAEKWTALLVVMLSTSMGIFVQAGAFRECIVNSSVKLNLRKISYIWAFGGLTSLIAPLVAGLAVRVAFLKREGVGLKDAAVATLRQTGFNLEFSLLSASVVLILYPWPRWVMAGWVMSLVWLGWWILRRWVVRGKRQTNWLFARIREIFRPLRWQAMFWLWGQLVVMSLTYLASFNLMGGVLDVHEAVLLSALTILISIAIVIPNGLGVLDGLWVWLATSQGLSMDASVALALTLRMGYLIGAAVIWITLALSSRFLGGDDNYTLTGC